MLNGFSNGPRNESSNKPKWNLQLALKWILECIQLDPTYWSNVDDIDAILIQSWSQIDPILIQSWSNIDSILIQYWFNIDPILRDPKWSPNYPRMGSKAGPEMAPDWSQNGAPTGTRNGPRLIPEWGPQRDPEWPPNDPRMGSQTGPEMAPGWSQNGVQNWTPTRCQESPKPFEFTAFSSTCAPQRVPGLGPLLDPFSGSLLDPGLHFLKEILSDLNVYLIQCFI